MPLLYLQLHDQLRQWIKPQDQRHLKGFCEILAGMLQAQSACMSKWIPFLDHRGCQARSHMDRLSYFLHNPQITADIFYEPLLRQALSAFAGSEVILTLDTSVLWDEFCLVEVCLTWGGRSLTLAQTVLKHGSATVSFETYQPVLERAKGVLPESVSVTLLADRGFVHGDLIRWARLNHWHWALRLKSDVNITLASGRTCPVEALFPPENHAHLFENVTLLKDVTAHLATAHLPEAQDTWAVLSDQPPSLQTFALYGKRFGGIEPHFKDYKSAAFHVIDSRLREPEALTRLFMLLDSAILIAMILSLILVQAGQRASLDWHPQRGLSFLQLGLRQIARLCCQQLLIPKLIPLTKHSPPAASASRRKRAKDDCHIEFAKVVRFS